MGHANTWQIVFGDRFEMIEKRRLSNDSFKLNSYKILALVCLVAEVFQVNIVFNDQL